MPEKYFTPELVGNEFELQQLDTILKLSVDDFKTHAQTLSSPDELSVYIARQLTEAMGGWITLESEPGDGATFIVTIPTTRNLEVPAPLSGAGRAG